MSVGGAHLLVFANEKGGSGKSTVAVHLAVAAAAKGYAVAAIDLDHRQRTFARYMENRAATAKREGLALPLVSTTSFDPASSVDIITRLDEIGVGRDLVIADTPGRDDINSLAVIGRADTLVTPINDSFLDFDLIGQVIPTTYRLERPSFYTRLIWEVRRERALKSGARLDWVVLRNRLQHIEAKNMRRVADALLALSRKAGFRVVPGLMERVTYREMFPEGLTSLDLEIDGCSNKSYLNARKEVTDLLASLGLPAIRRECRRQSISA